MVLVLSLPVLAVYWQVGGHAFITLDDAEYVAENPHVLRGLTREGVSWAFRSFHAANWHPLTWLSHMLDVELFGPDPGWHHRVNVLFHLLNTVLLFLVFRGMTGDLWPSAIVAALFGVHPLHVESVAWVAERKDVLSTLFWILTMGAHLRYVRRPSAGRYLAVPVLFAMGVMCKPMLVTLPFVLLLLDWWPLGRMSPEGAPVAGSWRLHLPTLSRRVWEKGPLLLMSAASCVITVLAQVRGNAVRSFDFSPIGTRIVNAFVSCGAYLWKTVWPASLAVFYPHPATFRGGIPWWEVGLALLVLGGFTALSLSQARQRPYLLVGWLWYLGTLVPVIGLVQVGSAAAADRYTYVPLIGVFLATAWGIPDLLAGRRFRRWVLGGAMVTAVMALAAVARVQVGYWRDSVTLYTRAIAVTERNWFAWNCLGVAHAKLGQTRQAIGHYREAIRIRPAFADAWINLGVAHTRLGENQQAIDHFREAVRLQPNYAAAWNNLGVARSKLGDTQQAIDLFREAVRLQPDYADAWYNLGIAFNKLGLYLQAIGSFREAVRLQPDYAPAWNNLGVAYNRLGDPRQAIGYFREAVRLRPDYALAWNNLGMAYEKTGQSPEAMECYREARRFSPE